ncbi:macro domain-containing protein [Vibrio parahaemolyticus]|uniref:macro domain-containing protein n=1 Tax=Vibrio parahaemolyticus TaxID=670 RepID=UPI002360BAF2|nr:macro domain-containing protein [Vibrio parahaemolyticus]
MSKVSFFSKKVRDKFLNLIAWLSIFSTLLFVFIDIPNNYKTLAGVVFILVLCLVYLYIWYDSNRLEEVSLDIEGSKVFIKKGDIFKQDGLKAIAFNEYFDTKVDNVIISENSLNGIFLNNHLKSTINDLDRYIDEYRFDDGEILGENKNRKSGKTKRHRIGTICVYEDYILTSLSRFDKNNRAVLTMPEYLGFLINFWDQVNRVYAQRSVSVPIFGSGITRIKEHKNISDEDLLKIMLWTFRISEMRFKYPANLTIVVHESKIDKINLLEIE